MRGLRQRQQSRYQRFVGVELAAVLEEVHRAHGSKANIVNVDRVRQGGVAGFFAKESYEVLVEGTGTGRTSVGPTGAVAAPPRVLSFEDLLARRLDEDDLRPLDDDPVAAPRSILEPDPLPAPEPPPAPAPSPGADAEARIGFELELGLGLDPQPGIEGLDGDLVLDDDLVLDQDLRLDGHPDPVEGPGPADLDLTDPDPAPVVVRSRLGSVDGWSVVGLEHRLFATPALVARAATGPAPRSALEFWAAYDQARQVADLMTMAPVAQSAIVGRLPTVEPVVRRCQHRHWSGQCRVYVLTDRRLVSGAPPDWTVVDDRDELVAVVERDTGEFPLLVIDVAPALPSWLRPLVDRLRAQGVGLVHYVLDGHPTDEDLATWHGEIGRPAVLDLVTPVAAERVLDLIERGEPLASVAGVPVTADLLFALRAEVARAR